MSTKKFRLTMVCVAFFASLAMTLRANVSVITDPQASPRELFGVTKLTTVLEATNFNAPEGASVLAAIYSSRIFDSVPNLARFTPGETEAFHLFRVGNKWLVVGSDASGVLYGCMELAHRCSVAGTLPAELNVTDKPAFKIRGSNLFWMKSGSNLFTMEKGGYNWPVVPQEFPWFFDRSLMIRYLDELAENRYNAIFFWNGHPFPFFLKLPRYPEAATLNDSDLERNIEYLKWFTAEADRRGIWTVFHFYNIHVSPGFAKAHQNEGVHVENAKSTPLLENYTRYCVSEFVKSYPNVGLMLTAGEALKVKPEEFVRDAIIPGIKDSGRSPPLIIRQWRIDPDRYRDIIKPNYENLYTMMKHNTEMIVSPYPDPRNKTWVSFGQNHIVNMHEMADVKPFRWGSPIFIQQMVSIWKSMNISGMHIYPMTSWMWPASLDKADILTIDRDRIWIEAFGRYGWQPDRPAAEEERFWKGKLAERFGSSIAGGAIYDFYTKTGPILPGLQNIVNIYNMNYHPTTVGQEASLNGILHSDRWEGVGDYLARPLDDFTLALYEQRFGKLDGPARLRPPLSVKQYLSPHEAAPDPLKVSALFVELAGQAMNDLRSAQGTVSHEPEEFARFITDSQCILYLAQFYHAKLEATVEKGLYDASGGTAHYDRMLEKLDESVSNYCRLDTLASSVYRQPTDLGDWYSWDTVRKGFEEEAAFYHEQKQISRLGADVVYLGVDGPVSDASNMFHWLLEDRRRAAGWTAQSYHLDKNPFARARLVVVYDTDSPDFRRYAGLLDKFLKRGGKLLVWDSQARAATSPLLNGITFATDSSHRSGDHFAFTDVSHPLIQGLAGSTITLDKDCTPASSMKGVSADWQELAYTVLGSVSWKQFYEGDQTFGPRWTSLMDPARVPLIVARHYGAGEIVFAQLGSYNAEPGSQNSPPKAPPHLRTLVDNLVTWAGAN
jgi:hypothetical protein